MHKEIRKDLVIEQVLCYMYGMIGHCELFKPLNIYEVAYIKHLLKA